MMAGASATSERDSRIADWTRGPAKHAAAMVLLAAALAGSAYVWWTPRVPATGVPAAGGMATRIDLNRASAGELQLLPRIGPALARRIVEDRAARGPFASVEDVARVRGIGPRTVELLRPYAMVSREERD